MTNGFLELFKAHFDAITKRYFENRGEFEPWERQKRFGSEDDCEIPLLIENAYFTIADLEPAFYAAARAGRDPQEIQFTFTPRNDLSEKHWMISGILKGKKK